VDNVIWWISWLHRSHGFDWGMGKRGSPSRRQHPAKEGVRERTRSTRRWRGGLLTIDVMIPRLLIGYRSLQFLVPGFAATLNSCGRGMEIGTSGVRAVLSDKTGPKATAKVMCAAQRGEFPRRNGRRRTGCAAGEWRLKSVIR
jgi:hypothetical protein